ncbi:methionyl aminopeptidase [Methanohalophilus levihalophilus]|uniref:type II methionyl aminopeptidase n=1 Tax=Methanohalophilus levihalophilus TaxID=1431282 RepID=UPI001AE7A221|nr:type II methionyl aminopeptidase [Methanohalophilus levihalophilus]MBP2029944.1 methionyl aminopeptidase [Methanohalophilus levihalophilus]
MADKLQELEEILVNYLTAGEILSTVRKEAKEKIKVGARLLDVAEFVEQRTIELGGKPAFPCNISRNEEAAHATPRTGDEDVFEKDMVKLDLGVHVEGYIADAAVTVDLSGNPDLVKASENALAAAIDTVKAGVNTAEIGAVIEETIRGYGFKPITNLTGHGVSRYLAHTPPSIPNRHVGHGVELEQGQMIAIEPFATDGAGKISEGALTEIFQIVQNKPIRMPAARKLLKELQEYKTLPFAKRWLTSPKLDLSLMQLERAGLITSYPVLKEVGGGLVSQAEHTVVVTEDGCEIITT